MTLATLALDAIQLEGTQVRAAIDDTVVADYAALMAEGAVFPPIAVFFDGDTHYLADGYHRVRAAQRLGRTTITADVHPGTREDALWFALGANRTNGQRLTNRDKTHAVTLAIATWPDRVDREIAAQVGCSHSLVWTVGKKTRNSTGEQVRRGQALKTHRKEVAVRALLEAGKRPTEVRKATGADTVLVAKIRREIAHPQALPPMDHSKAASATRLEAMRELALAGATSHQIASEVGLGLEGCRRILRREQIAVPGDVVTYGTRHLNATRIMEQIVIEAENLSQGANLIDFASLDRTQIDDWMSRLTASRAFIAKIIRLLLQEKSHGEAAQPTAVQDLPGADQSNPDADGARDAAGISESVG